MVAALNEIADHRILPLILDPWLRLGTNQRCDYKCSDYRDMLHIWFLRLVA
jgi:hypothetical protein